MSKRTDAVEEVMQDMEDHNKSLEVDVMTMMDFIVETAQFESKYVTEAIECITAIKQALVDSKMPKINKNRHIMFEGTYGELLEFLKKCENNE